MEGESSKMCTGANKGRGVEKSVIRYVRTYTPFDFLKRNSYTNVFLKFLYDAKLITPLLIF